MLPHLRDEATEEGGMANQRQTRLRPLSEQRAEARAAQTSLGGTRELDVSKGK